MTTGRSMQLTKQVGEYLVSAELCRLGFIATTFTGNVPEFDILAINEKYETIPIQVKAIRAGSWQFNARKLLDISIRDDKQQVNGKKDLQYSKLICIYVKLISRGKDEFYIFRLKNLQDIIFNGYSSYLREHRGRRPKNPNSTHTAVSPKDLSKYRDKWDLLKERYEQGV